MPHNQPQPLFLPQNSTTPLKQLISHTLYSSTSIQASAGPNPSKPQITKPPRKPQLTHQTTLLSRPCPNDWMITHDCIFIYTWYLLLTFWLIHDISCVVTSFLSWNSQGNQHFMKYYYFYTSWRFDAMWFIILFLKCLLNTGAVLMWCHFKPMLLDTRRTVP